jgi:oligopeptide/dipeptide ABC transporter ATP-binding protein
MNQLELRDLKTYFFLDEGILKAVDGVNLTVGERETIGIIGESGCGKSVMSKSIMRLVTKPGEIVTGAALLNRKDGSKVDIFALEPDSPELRSIRGNEIAMIFQEPMTAFSPVHTIGDQISEMVALHTGLDSAKTRDRAVGLLDRVGISNPNRRYDQYPHELSGGMRQRAMIALALSCTPKIILADEPTTAQAQILNLLKDLQKGAGGIGLSYLFIAHDLAVVEHISDRVAVLYVGKIVELARSEEVFSKPRHPYTEALLSAVPLPDPTRKSSRMILEGEVANPANPPSGCYFHPRCPYATEVCKKETPQWREISPEHFVLCHHADQLQMKGMV